MDLHDDLVDQLQGGPLSAEKLYKGLPEGLIERANPRKLEFTMRRDARFIQLPSGLWARADLEVAAGTGPDAGAADPERTVRVEEQVRPVRSDATGNGRTGTPLTFLEEADELEQVLSERLRGARLVAEAGIDRQLHGQVCAAARSALRRLMWDVPAMGRRYPALFLCHLVGHGVFGAEGGFWPSLRREGFERDATAREFERCLSRLRLEYLDEIVDEEGGLRYLSRIIVHGAVPERSLDDYAGLIRRGLRYGRSASDMLSTWASMSSVYRTIDVGIGRFLRLGEAFAEDFLDRSIDAFLGEADEASSGGLPPYVYRYLRDAGSCTRVPASVRAIPPRVVLNPWTPEGPELLVPSSDNLDLIWVVDTGNGSRRVRAAGREQRIPLGRAAEWTVAGEEHGREVLRRRIPALPRQELEPVLFFDAESGQLLRADVAIPDDLVVVMHRVGVDISVESSGEWSPAQLVECYPDLGPPWDGYTAALVDLLGVQHLRVNGRAWRVAAKGRATLGGQPLPNVDSNGLPVYSEPPYVCLPPGTDPANWTLTVDVDGRRTTFRGLEAGPDGAVTLMIPDRLELVTVVARGPLGSDLRASFLFVPGLDVSVPDRITLPGDPPLRVRATAGRGIMLNGQEIFTATVASDDGDQTLELEVRQDGVGASLAVTLPLIRWRWIGTSDGETGRCRQIETADLTAGIVRGLAGATGIPDLHVALCLTSGGQTIQQQTIRTGRRRGEWAFPLGPFADTVRANVDRLELQLMVGAHPVKVAVLSPTYVVEDVTINSQVVGDRTAVQIDFEQNAPLNGRIVRFWSCHRLWEPPVERNLPGTTRTHGEFSFWEELPPGEYLVQLGLADWAEVRRPLPGDRNVVRALIGSRQDQWRRLEDLSDQSPSLTLERFLFQPDFDAPLPTEDTAALAPLALAALLELVRAPDAQLAELQLMDALAAIVAASAAELVRVLLDRCADEPLEAPVRARLAALLLPHLSPLRPSRIADADLEALWRTAPALAAALEPCCSGDTEQAERFELLAGTEEFKPVLLRGLSQNEAGLGAERLEEIAAEVGLRGTPPFLGGEGGQLAQFEWLRAAATGAFDPQEFWRRWRRRLPHPPVVSTENELEAVGRRRARNAEEWVSLPMLPLIAALHVRHRSDSRAAASELLYALAGQAPLLVERDLATVALLNGDPKLEERGCLH